MFQKQKGKNGNFVLSFINKFGCEFLCLSKSLSREKCLLICNQRQYRAAVLASVLSALFWVHFQKKRIKMGYFTGRTCFVHFSFVQTTVYRCLTMPLIENPYFAFHVTDILNIESVEHFKHLE